MLWEFFPSPFFAWSACSRSYLFVYKRPLSRLWASFSSPHQFCQLVVYRVRADLRSSWLVIDFVFDLNFALDFSLSSTFEVSLKIAGCLCYSAPISWFLDSSLFVFWALHRQLVATWQALLLACCPHLVLIHYQRMIQNPDVEGICHYWTHSKWHRRSS